MVLCCPCSPDIFTNIFTYCVDICCRSDTDSESVEETPPAKRQRTTDTQPNRIKDAHDGGNQFEIKMAAVIGLRGMGRGDNFELATNVIDAGNFGDIVYTAGGRRYFLHLKHTDNPGTNRLVHSELVPLLNSCFETYINMADKDESEFIIYTNQHLGSRLLNHKVEEPDVDTIFKTSEREKIYKFTPDDDKENDVYTLLEESMMKNKEYKCLSDQEKESKPKRIKEFLNKLIIVTGQKDQWELDDLIAEEIINQDKIQVDHEVYTSILRHFKMRLENWWSNGKEKMTPETLRAWLQKAKTESCVPVVRRLFDSCTKQLVSTEIKFSDREKSRLQKELSNKRAVHLRSDAPSLCRILLLACLPQSKSIFVTLELLQSNDNMLLYAWLGGHWEWLIVSCDSTVRQSDISETFIKISEILKHHYPTKRVIILTASSVQEIKGFDPVEHKFKFEQLSKQSQEMVLDKKIDFQGCEVTMRSVLQKYGNVEHVLGAELVTDLVTESTAVNIGDRLQQNTEHYEPRVFKRKIWLPLDTLRKQSLHLDIFAVSGIEKIDLIDIIPSDEEVGNFDEDSVSVNSTQRHEVFRKRFIVLKGRNLKSSFLKLCRLHSRETLHWLKYKDGKLLWKQTCGDIENLLNCTDAVKTGTVKQIIRECKNKGTSEMTEDSIWDLGERTVLVVAEPGMGKSSTTTQVAWNTKLANPTSWVVRINWNDHTRELQEINTATFNLDSLVEFLCRTAFPESKYTDINRILLKQALQNSGNVTVLMDGFDEISPTHADKAAVILSELMKTKVERVWVTSRPVEKDRLEKELSVNAWNMKSLSNDSQRTMFLNLWLPKVNVYKNGQNLVGFINRSLLLAYDLYQDRNFTGTPGYVKLIATALETHLQTGDFNGPHKMDFFHLYDRLVEKKLHVQERSKKEEDLNSFQDDHDNAMGIYLDILEQCSLLVTLPSEQQALHKTKTRNGKLSIDAEKVRDRNDKISIVMKVVNGKPQFVHHTVAEYFTARWFSRNFELNRRVLERIIFDPRYKVMTDIFYRLLAKDCPLHCAVLEEDTKNVKTLLREGCDVSARDKGGKTALHLIAARGRDGPTCEEITNSLLQNGACVQAEDLVLQWTALRYAIEAEKWFVVERLLEIEYNTIELEHIRQRVEHESYIGKIIAHTAGKNCMSLLQYLRKICADTKWAPIVDVAVARK